MVTHAVTISVKGGSGQICAAKGSVSYCTGSVIVVTVNDGDTIAVNCVADSGYTFDHYDGAGLGQPQTFTTAVTDDILIGVFFTSGVSPLKLYTGDTITVQNTVTGAPTITAHLIRFYDGAGKQVGKYTQDDPEFTDMTGGVYTIAHQSSEADQSGTWKCHWQITVTEVIDSEELDIEVYE